ncbi:MAG: DUF4396 domain-containing protein, partial [Acidobacteriota bacterium]
PVTALYSGPVGLWAYYRIGRAPAGGASPDSHKKMKEKRSFPQSVGLGATHCGSGCTLGDIVAEWFLFFFPLTLFGMKIFAAWTLDYVLALLFGIAFQYYTIKPMRGLSVKEGLIAALKADILSLTSWQIGMYGWMAIATFIIFGHEMEKTDPRFWFMMQIAMIAGFLTAYPVNWWLIRKGIKERM